MGLVHEETHTSHDHQHEEVLLDAVALPRHQHPEHHHRNRLHGLAKRLRGGDSGFEKRGVSGIVVGG